MFINTSGSSPYNNLNSSLKQIHYRHRKQGEKEDDYGTEGDDYPLGHLDDGGTTDNVPLSPMVLLRKVIICFRSLSLCFSRYFSICSQIFLYTPFSIKESRDFGIVWRLPQLGQGIGWEYTVACHSISRASKTWPQSSHLNVFFPRNIVRYDS